MLINRKINTKKISKLLLLLLLFYILINKSFNLLFDNYIYFLNVGQGEMAAIKTRDSFGLIDLGSTKKGLAFNVLKNFMKYNNIRNIDYIIISHMHADHINGIIEVIKNYKVGTIIYSYPPNISNKEYIELIEYIRKAGIKTLIVESGDEILIGKKLNINILLAGQGEIIDSDMDNANSIILELISNKKKVLFMGDATKATEKELIKNIEKKEKSVFDMKYNGIKIGHHGSKTSTSKELVEIIKFNFAVISAKKKEFGHPSKETIDILNKYMIKQYITEKDGALKYNLN